MARGRGCGGAWGVLEAVVGEVGGVCLRASCSSCAWQGPAQEAQGDLAEPSYVQYCNDVLTCPRLVGQASVSVAPSSLSTQLRYKRTSYGLLLCYHSSFSFSLVRVSASGRVHGQRGPVDRG